MSSEDIVITFYKYDIFYPVQKGQAKLRTTCSLDILNSLQKSYSHALG